MDLPDPDELLGRLSIWASEQRAEQAKLEREQARRAREVALDEMRLSGLLRDVYESQYEICVVTCDGSRTNGHITETGSDYVAVGTPGYGSTLVAIDAVDRLDIRHPITPSDRSLDATRTLATALDLYCQHRVRLSLKGHAGTVCGRLEGAGHDMVVIHVEGQDERRAFVPLKRIATLSVATST